MNKCLTALRDDQALKRFGEVLACSRAINTPLLPNTISFSRPENKLRNIWLSDSLRAVFLKMENRQKIYEISFLSALTTKQENSTRILCSFSILDSLGVRDFLDKNAYLAPLLKKIAAVVPSFFETAVLKLSIFTDPEDITFDTQLILSIVTNYPASEARARLKRFDDDWWLDEMLSAQGKLCITIEAQ
jgi:hypothetical protein